MAKELKQIIQKLADNKDLTADEAKEAMQEIMSGSATDAQIAGFLTAMRMKGETPEEIASLALIMRKFAENIHPKVSGTLVDTCGTGGDKLDTFNISTTAMFVVAGAGIPIAKHGNRSVSSQCGSADVLEALGVKIDFEPKKVEECIEKIGIGFMFAPLFHKSMKYVMPARTQLGIRTVFNILGPLSNPANAQGQVIGVFDEKLTEKITEVLKIIGIKKAMVVHGMHGLDEISTIGETKISELINGKINNYIINPGEFGLKRANAEDLAGGDAKENARILINILKGEDLGARKDIVLLNAAAGIVVGGRADSIMDGLKLAKDAVDSGRAYRKLEEMIAYR